MSSITTALLTLCFVAGKSGGHLLPCITQAEKFLHEKSTNQAYLFSSGTNLDKKIMQHHPTIQHYIPTSLDSIPYKKPWLFPLFIFNMSIYFINSLYKLSIIKPAKVISFGGLNSIPVCIGSRLLVIPFELYELNVDPGQSITFLSYFTDTIHICFSETAQYFTSKKCILSSYPIRFTQDDLIFDKKTILQNLNLLENKQTILILGGSQGSIALNQSIKQCILHDTNFAQNIQIIHQTGMSDQDNYKDFYNQHNIPAVVFTYNEQLQNFYNVADLIICRAGAGTLFEVDFFKKPCIIVPLKTDLNDHQLKNAYAMQKMRPQYFHVILQSESIETFKQSIQMHLNL